MLMGQTMNCLIFTGILRRRKARQGPNQSFLQWPILNLNEIATMILVTGAAGFIGAHVCEALSALGENVVGCDNFNTYYDPQFKHARVNALLTPRGIACENVDIADQTALAALFDSHPIKRVVHLAGQAGVRASITHPELFVQANLVGFANMLEACRRHQVDHLVYASSSSVYGNRSNPPFRENDATDHPASFYAATKMANELMANAYAYTHGMAMTGLRFFTVYGPWGRPDMAYFSFAQKIRANQAITVYGEGLLQRDFTYVNDIVQGVVKLLFKPPQATADKPAHWVCNIGNSQPVAVIDFVHMLENALGQQAIIDFQPTPKSDVPLTAADTQRLEHWVGFAPNTPLEEGLARFVAWFDEWQTTQPAT